MSGGVGAGGIQRYMEAFPAGGFFRGKNFVFDERVTVGGGDAAVLGACLACGAPHDSYEPRARCARCRMLVLVCPGCAAEVRGGLPAKKLCLSGLTFASACAGIILQLAVLIAWLCHAFLHPCALFHCSPGHRLSGEPY